MAADVATALAVESAAVAVIQPADRALGRDTALDMAAETELVTIGEEAPAEEAVVVAVDWEPVAESAFVQIVTRAAEKALVVALATVAEVVLNQAADRAPGRDTAVDVCSETGLVMVVGEALATWQRLESWLRKLRRVCLCRRHWRRSRKRRWLLLWIGGWLKPWRWLRERR